MNNCAEVESALLNIVQALDTAKDKLYRVALGTQDFRLLPCPDLPAALADRRKRDVILEIAPGDFTLHIRGVRRRRRPFIEVRGFGQVSAEVLDAVVRAIDPFRRDDEPSGGWTRWLTRPWIWFANSVGSSALAAVIGGSLVALFVAAGWIAWLADLF